ncbi:ROK family transcriptional regulator [Streptomyces sp. NPDC048277]|uniref:ROK family transcriptional regulator n=1 Tax=Streptomyces sp. NPDC048277 TaxID=3155027 RepID=UPI0033EB9F12
MRNRENSGADQAFIRAHNAQAALRALRHTGTPATLSQLAKTAGLSRPTVESVLADLTARGWAEELPPDDGAMGRPARRFRFHAAAGHAVGLDIGMRKALVIVTDLGGRVVATRRCALGDDLPGPDRLERAGNLVEECLQEARLAPSSLWALTVGLPGLMDRAGRMTRSTVLPGLTGVNLSGYFADRFGCRVNAENDANLATLAEHWRGCARHVDDVVYILAGRRTGAGMIVGGRLHRGPNGAAGEIGNLRMLGWWDAPGDLESHGADAAAVFGAAQADPEAAEAVRAYTSALSNGIAALVLTLDPDLVVIGGGLSRAGEQLLQPLRDRLGELCLTTPRIEVSALGDESVALGAVRTALDHIDQEVFEAGLQL